MAIRAAALFITFTTHGRLLIDVQRYPCITQQESFQSFQRSVDRIKLVTQRADTYSQTHTYVIKVLPILKGMIITHCFP